jgi:hypothetical protein
MEKNVTEHEEAILASRSHKLVLIGLLLSVGISVWFQYEPHSFLRRDASFYATITRGLSENGSLRAESLQPASWYSGEHPQYQELDASWSNVSVGVNGKWYPKHSFVMSAIALPFYEVFGVLGLLIFNVFAVVFLLFSSYLIAYRFVRGPPLIFALVLLGTGATFVDQSYHFSADVFSAAIVLAGFACLQHRVSLWAGILFGLALWARPTLVILIAPVAFAMSYRILSKRDVRRVALGLVPCIFASALSNWLMFGAPWTSGYERILVVHGGVPALDSATNLFTIAWDDGLKRMFTSTKHGFIELAPAALLAVVGLGNMARRSKRMTLALAVSVLGYVCFFVTYRYSHPRFFLAWMGLLAAPLAVLLQDLSGGLERLLNGSNRSSSRLAPWIISILAALGLVSQLSPHLADSNTLTGRITQATVTRDAIHCDYFNMRHGRWECSKIEKHLWEYTGLALHQNECRFGGTKRDMILFHPPLPGVKKEISFPIDENERLLTFTLGLADSAVSHRTCVDIRLDQKNDRRVCADKKGTFVVEDIELQGASTVTFSTKGRLGGRRHLCLQGSFSD